MQQHIANKKLISTTHTDRISIDEIVEYLNGVDGTMFGVETFAPVYEFGKSIKEIDLLWAPTIERMWNLLF